jgi:hypothetical protein
LRPLVRARHVGTALIALFISGAVTACTFVVDLEPLKNKDCGDAQKVCIDAMDSVEKCVDITDSRYGCNSRECHPCVVDHARAQCSTGGLCAIAACDAGYADCDGQDGNGCETHTAAEIDNCGNCGIKCNSETIPNADVICMAGVCTVTECQGTFDNCDTININGCECDLTTNECQGDKGELCCPQGFAECTDADGDDANDGCACADGMVCNDGVCEPPPP